jgi:hypothetical protein
LLKRLNPAGPALLLGNLPLSRLASLRDGSLALRLLFFLGAGLGHPPTSFLRPLAVPVDALLLSLLIGHAQRVACPLEPTLARAFPGERREGRHT